LRTTVGSIGYEVAVLVAASDGPGKRYRLAHELGLALPVDQERAVFGRRKFACRVIFACLRELKPQHGEATRCRR
jgi:hypothetical protein